MEFELRRESDIEKDGDNAKVYNLKVKEPGFEQMAMALDNADQIGYRQAGDRLLESVVIRESTDDEVLSDPELRLGACVAVFNTVKMAEVNFKKK